MRKLKLNRETIRGLTDKQLTLVAGGKDVPTMPNTAQTSCMITMPMVCAM